MEPLLPLIPPASVQVTADAPLIKAIEAIDSTDAKMALVTGGSGRVVGSLTDGDIRRAFLKGCTLQSPSSEAMHTNPYVMPVGCSRQQVIDMMLSAQIKQMPLLNPDGTLAGIAVYDMLTGFLHVPRSNPVVIMAGGMGTRLLPITENIPKPMVEVGGKPMLEHIITQFVNQGFSNFHIALNYLGHIIEDYFGDGSRFSCKIHYIREQKSLGTAGALSLIEHTFTEPFIVINGDIMSSVDFAALLEYHITSNSTATVCARQHRVEVPFGVIQLKNGMLQAIVEKPVYEDLVSAGIYALNPDALAYIAKDKRTDMPTLLHAIIEHNKKIAVFPLREHWVDVGRHDDLEMAKRHYSEGK